MLEQAIAKVRTEMTQEAANSYIQVVGEFLLQHLNSNQVAAEKIMNADKSIGKSLDEMRKVAGRKKKIGNCAVLTDQEGFAAVLKYFGIENVVNMQRPVDPAPAPAPVSAPVAKPKSAIDFNISLDDLL